MCEWTAPSRTRTTAFPHPRTPFKDERAGRARGPKGPSSILDRRPIGCGNSERAGTCRHTSRGVIMGLGCGPPRKLTDTQIRQVLSWHACRQKFRAQQGSVHQLAARLGVNTDVIHCCIARYRSKGNRPLRVKGAVGHIGPRRGRPPLLSHIKVRAVEAWYRRHSEFIERTGTAQALARRMGVSVRTIHDCIRRHGRYIQHSESRLNRTRSARTSRGAKAEIQWRSVLLRRWRRSPR